MPQARWLVGFVLLMLVVYSPVLQAGFIWDDDVYVEYNPTLRDLKGLERIWLEPGRTPQYYPLVFTTFWLEYQLWGAWPTGYHVVNIFLHAASCMLMGVILTRLQVPGAWFAACIFGLHPVQVESVAWVTELKNVQSGLLYAGSLLAYLHFDPLLSVRPTERRRWYTLSLVLFVGALLSKSVTCSLPAAILLLTWWKRGRLTRADVLATLPFFVLGLLMARMTVSMETSFVGASGSEWNLSFVERCLIAGRALWFYAGKLVFPVNLAFIYPRWHIDLNAWWQYVYPAAFLTVLATLWLGRQRFGRGPLVGVLYFAGTLFPALGFFNIYPMRYSFVADHFQYLACAGLIVPAAAGLSAWAESHVPRAKIALAGVVVAVLCLLTYPQTLIYHGHGTLWQDTVVKNPDGWLGHTNLAATLVRQLIEESLRKPGTVSEESYDRVVRHVERALEIKPTSYQPYGTWGKLLTHQGRIAEAEEKYKRAVELCADQNVTCQFDLGMFYREQGRKPEAVVCLENAVRINDYFTPAHQALAEILTEMGQNDRAAHHRAKANVP